MKLTVIEGGRRDFDGSLRPVAPPRASDVHAEAWRRVRLTGYDAWRIREFATGVTMPKTIRYLQMQITFAAEALARLERIPEDFRSDIYWPIG